MAPMNTTDPNLALLAILTLILLEPTDRLNEPPRPCRSC